MKTCFQPKKLPITNFFTDNNYFFSDCFDNLKYQLCLNYHSLSRTFAALSEY